MATMFIVTIPQCQQPAQVVAEFRFKSEGHRWHVTSCETDAEGYGDTFDEAVAEFARNYARGFEEG